MGNAIDLNKMVETMTQKDFECSSKCLENVGCRCVIDDPDEHDQEEEVISDNELNDPDEVKPPDPPKQQHHHRRRRTSSMAKGTKRPSLT